MAIKEVTMYRAVCDDCGKLCPEDDQEIIAWESASSAVEVALKSEWRTEGDGRLLCEECVWKVEEARDEPGSP